MSFLGQLTEEVAHTFPSHIVAAEIEAQREVRIGALVTRVTRWLTGPPPRWNNSDESESSWLFGNKELRLQHGVGRPRRLRVAEVVLKAVTGKRLESGRRLEEGHPWVCSAQTLLKQEIGLGDC